MSADHEDGGDPVGPGRVVHSGGRVGEEGEHPEADDDDRGAEHDPPGDLLAGEEIAERQRPDHRRDEERLDDRDAPPVERRPLQQNTDDLRA